MKPFASFKLLLDKNPGLGTHSAPLSTGLITRERADISYDGGCCSSARTPGGAAEPRTAACEDQKGPWLFREATDDTDLLQLDHRILLLE